MKTSSAKAKGRSLQNYVVKKLRLLDNYGYLEEGDIRPAIMGETGTDIKLSPKAKEVHPWDIECKNQEKWDIPNWWKQATANTEEGRKPLLVIKKNRHEPLIIMRFDDLLELL